jgi:hypothetical protein
VGWDLSQLGTAVTAGQLVEWRLVGEAKELGRNVPERHFVHHKSQILVPDTGSNAGRRGGEPATNRLSYGAAITSAVGTTVSTGWQL